MNKLDTSNNNVDFVKRIKIILYMKNISQKELSGKFGSTDSVFYLRCKTGKMNFEEQAKIADILGCKFVALFSFEDGAVYSANTIKKVVMDSCAHVGMSLSELAKQLGRSRQNFHSKLNNGRFTDIEIAEMANLIGCKYINYFELEDGTRI